MKIIPVDLREILSVIAQSTEGGLHFGQIVKRAERVGQEVAMEREIVALETLRWIERSAGVPTPYHISETGKAALQLLEEPE